MGYPMAELSCPRDARMEQVDRSPFHSRGSHRATRQRTVPTAARDSPQPAAARRKVSFEDWIFALHLLSAATLVGALVMSWIVVVASLSAHTPEATLNLHRVGIVGTGATIFGLAGAFGFGIWLAILHDAFQVWDGWVIAAIVLWAIATVGLLRSFAEYQKPVEKARALAASGQNDPSTELTALNRASTGLVLRALASAAVVLIVIDMIWKPGA
jgi:hypothetical protein